MMKKYLYFIVTFAAIFIALQILSGAALMAMYTPDMSVAMWGTSGNIESTNNILSPVVLAIIALSATFGAFKVFSKKFGGHHTIV